MRILLKKRVANFISEGCGCKYGPNSTHCSDFLTKDVITKSRQACLELSRDELDLVIISNICAFQTLPTQPTLRKSHHAVQGSSEVLRCESYLHGVRVCRTAFLFLHCMSCFRYDSIVSHYKQTGLCTRFHGNSKHAPANAIPYEGVHHLVSFIKNFAKAHVMPLSGRIPGHRDKVMILPSDITVAIVYTKYRDASTANGSEPVGRSKFYSVWQQSLPQISISKPSSDLCYTCQKNRLAIQKAGYLSEKGKAELYKVALDHIQRAQTEREYYKSQVAAAEASWSASEDASVSQP